jgi:MoaA/NifB/PqqE/SkfB family radical SAM enzyme
VALLEHVLIDASAGGYNVASFAGGEPLLYKPLRQILDRAHQCGMVTTVTSNGMVLTEQRLEQLQDAIDLLAISLDGVPASHNRMRASEYAFETMVGRLEGVRQSGIPFGFIFTLTQYNLHELDWVANFALEQGAKLLQIHPLEDIGRAQQLLSDSEPDEIESSYAYLEVVRLQTVMGQRLFIQLDLFSRDFLRSHPEHVFASPAMGDREQKLAALVSPLIIETDGTVVPIEYGFARQYALVNLQQASLSELGAKWRQERYPSFRHLCQQVFEQMTAPPDRHFINWYAAIAREAILTD